MIRFAVVFWLIAGAAWAADVDPSLCRDVDDGTRPLVPPQLRLWYKFDHVVQACPVYSRKHRFLWWIITLNLVAEPWEAEEDPNLYPLNPGGFTKRRPPKPYIVASDGRELGRISDAFPSGGFGYTDLFLSQWVDGFPRHITVKVIDGGVTGDYVSPPLQWNTKTKYYDQIGKGLYDFIPPLKQK